MLSRLAASLESHPLLAYLLLTLLYLLAALYASSQKLLWHDELFTWYIAGAPSLPAMFHDIRTIDLNPPLSYLLTRASFHLFGHNALACRLPEIAGFLLAMLALASFVRRRSGVLYGILAASLLFSSLAGELAIEARPYGLLLGFTCLGLVAWQRARETTTSRSVGLLLLPLSAAGMLLSHVFGLLPWAVLGGAELVRVLRSSKPRHLDWTATLLWIVPLACCLSYAPMLQNHAASAYPAALQPTGEDVFLFYITHVARELITLWLTALGVLLLLGRRHLRGSLGFRLTVPEWTVVIGLLVLPSLLIADLMHAHAAWFPRYGVVASVGVAILASVFLCWWTACDPRPALLATIISLLISGQVASAASSLVHLHPRHLFATSNAPIPVCEVCAITTDLDPNLPLVDASGLTFLEMDHCASSAELHRVFYLTDHAAALTYAHATIFDGMALEAQLFPIRAHVAPYQQFLAEHPHFFVLGQYDYPEDWLLRKLSADGADIRVRGRVGGPYKDHELYEVIVSPR